MCTKCDPGLNEAFWFFWNSPIDLFTWKWQKKKVLWLLKLLNSSSKMGLGSAYFRSGLWHVIQNLVCSLIWETLSWRPFFLHSKGDWQHVAHWKILSMYFNREATRVLCSGFLKGMIQTDWWFHQLWKDAGKFSCTLTVETNMEGLYGMTCEWFKPHQSDQFAFQTLNNCCCLKMGHFILCCDKVILVWAANSGLP